MIDDAPTGIPEPIWRAAMDAANNVAWPYEDTPAPMIDDEYDLAKCVRAAVEHLIEHLNTTAPSITPDQMQDGKRYRVVFEGTKYDHALLTEIGEEMRALPMQLLPGASRIEEIGGDS